MNQINFVPAAVQIRSAIGATVAIRFNAKNPDGSPFDLTPYTVSAPFVTDDGTVPPVPAWTAVIDLSSVVLSITDANTVALAPAGKSITWHWAVWLANAAAPARIMFAHGDLGLLPP